MGDNEIRDSISSSDNEQNTSLDEIMEQYEQIKDNPVKNPKDREISCKGNIASGCVQAGLHTLAEARDAADAQTAIYGGIGVQLRALEGYGDSLSTMGRFGIRETEDIDVLVLTGEENTLEEEVERLEEPGEAEVHVKSGYIPGSDEMVRNAERIDFGQYHEDLDFELDVLTGTDLLYSKVFSQLGDKKGTKYDIGVMIDDLDSYNIDRDELAKKIHQQSPDPETSFSILRRRGLDLQ